MSITVRTASIGVPMVLALSLLEGLNIASSQAGGATATASTAQTSAGALSNGVYAESGNRLPLVKRDDLDDLGKTLYDEIDADVKSGRALAGFQGPLAARGGSGRR